MSNFTERKYLCDICCKEIEKDSGGLPYSIKLIEGSVIISELELRLYQKTSMYGFSVNVEDICSIGCLEELFKKILKEIEEHGGSEQ